MTSLPSVDVPPVLGAQRPRICLVPEGPFLETARVAIEICELAGLHLDEWQRWLLMSSLAEREDGRWAAFEVGGVVPRQNGKGSTLEGRELTGLFAIDEERLIIHSAHEQATSSEHQRRLLNLIEGVPEFDRKVKRVLTGKGMEAIELKDGSRILFKTRTGGGGRGLTGDLVVLDEAMILSDTVMAALVPTMAARSKDGNPQMWLTGSAVDQLNPKHDGLVLSRLRSRALKGARRLLFAEWSAEGDDPSALTDDVLSDPEVWARANPGLGLRITVEHVENELGALGAREFAVERLGVGDWPNPDPDSNGKIPVDAWDALEDRASRRSGSVCFVFDVSPDGGSAAIAVGGHREDGLEHVEIVEHRQGVAWLEDRIVELDTRHEPELIECDGRGPAAEFVGRLANRGVKVETVDASGHAEACQSLVGAVEAGSFRHLGDVRVRSALRGAATRPLGDSWAWARKTSSADISPLVAFTLARRRAELMRESVYEMRGAAAVSLDDDE